MSTFLTVNHPQVETFDLDQTALVNFADNLLQETGKSGYNLSLVLSDDDQVHELNRTYRNKDSATNVLSFPFEDGAEEFLATLPVHELGDIVISLDTAAKEAIQFEETLSYRLSWLTTHGLLHLLGMDHERSEEEAEEMFAKEKELLCKYCSS